MTVFLKAVGIIATWLPIVINVIRQVEVLFSDKTGPEKKEAAMKLVKDTFAARGIALTVENLAIVSGLLDFAVALLNKIQDWRRPQVEAQLKAKGMLE